MKTEQSNFDELPDSAFVRLPTVSLLCGGTDRATIYKWVKHKKFPPYVKIAGSTTAWNVGELRRHFAELAAA